MFAEVIIDIGHHDVNQLYDYGIPEHLTPILDIGMRVFVPFNNQKRSGIVIDIKETSRDATKNIVDIDTVFPVLSDHDLNLITLLVKKNHMLYQQAIQLVVPHIFKLKYYYEIHVIKHDPLLDELKMLEKGRTYRLLKKDEYHLSKLKLRQEKGILTLSQRQAHAGPKKDTYVYQYTGKPYMRLDAIISSLSKSKTYDKDALVTLGLSNSNIKTLVKYEVLKKETVSNLTISLPNKQPQDQQTYIVISSFENMLKDLNEKIAITQNNNNNNNMLILTPNHSVLSCIQEQTGITHTYDHRSSPTRTLNLIKLFQKSSGVLISTRKGMFLPIHFDYIYVIESHAKTYRYDQGVFFDTIETLPYMHPHATIMLHTYTLIPQLLHLKKAKIQFNQHHQNHENNVHVISMKDELLDGHTKVLSRKVLAYIKEALKTKSVLLYYPRKGYQKVNVCRLCGDIQQCPTCHTKVKVTSSHQAYCTTCNQAYPLLSTCQHNHKNMMKPLGLGLDFLSKNIQTLFTDHPVYIIDKDHPIDINHDEHAIYIGTQKIQAYMHAIQTDTIIVVLADLSFHTIDPLDDESQFFDLFTLTPQSHQKIRQTFIQTYDPSHPMIKGLFDPFSFMKEKLEERVLLSLPPLTKVFHIIIEHKASYFKGYQTALKLIEVLRHMEIQVVGPLYEGIQPFILLVKVFDSQLDRFYDFVKSQHLHSRRIQ